MSLLIHLLALDVVLDLVIEVVEEGRVSEGKGSLLVSAYLGSNFRL